MYGTGILKGLGVTLKRFVGTYVDDIRWLGKRYFNDSDELRRFKLIDCKTSGSGVVMATYQLKQIKCLTILQIIFCILLALGRAICGK